MSWPAAGVPGLCGVGLCGVGLCGVGLAASYPPRSAMLE